MCPSVCLSRIGAHTVCNDTFTSVLNMPAVVLKTLKEFKIVLAGVPGVALSLQEHIPFIRLRLNFRKLL